MGGDELVCRLDVVGEDMGQQGAAQLDRLADFGEFGAVREENRYLFDSRNRLVITVLVDQTSDFFD